MCQGHFGGEQSVLGSAEGKRSTWKVTKERKMSGKISTWEVTKKRKMSDSKSSPGRIFGEKGV